MKVNNVTIENYRSIEYLELDLNAEGGNYCRILAGINESGKSNVLKAIALLSKENTVTYSKDVNKKAKSDKKNIVVTYTLEQTAIDKLIDFMANSGVSLDIIGQLSIDRIDRVVSFDNLSARLDYFKVHLKDTPKLSGYRYSFASLNIISEQEADEELIHIEPVVDTIMPSTTLSTTPIVAKADNVVEQISLDTKEDWEGLLQDYYADVTLSDDIPRVIFWSYDDKYLINKPIDLTEFSTSPILTSRPLYNVFNLADYNDAQISAVIDEALSDSAVMGELTDRLARTATKYLEEVWPEHKVEIKVHPDSPSITFHVVEKSEGPDEICNRYEVSERSDGFRHFFAILLNLAAENTTSKLEDCLILLDEPEIHLHPSGAKFLRDELLKIAINNIVIYSTHSIFMIDKSCLDRHYKIYKEGETTQKIKIDSSNPFKEDLIYEALGTSLLDLISEHNLLLEGLTDRRIFEAFTRKFNMDIKPLDITVMNVDGESHFDTYCKFFNKKSIKGYILADSDADGIRAKERILKNNPNEYNINNTFVINDIVQTNKESCLEDLFPKDVLEKCISDFCGVGISIDESKTFKDQIINYNKNAKKYIDLSKLKMFISNYIVDDIAKKNMTRAAVQEKYSDYYEFIVNLHNKLKNSDVNG